MTSGRFICLEGIEGTGKTTQTQFISHYLKQANQKAITTREPGGTPLAEAIRQLILHPPSPAESLMKETELLLLFAARAQHIAHVIQPALQAGYWVICDRFTEASYAYQGGGRGISNDFIHYLQHNLQKNITVDRVFLLDMPVNQAFKQATQRNQQADRIEAENQTFFSRVRQAYLDRAAQCPELYRIIDATVTLEAVQMQIAHYLDELLN